MAKQRRKPKIQTARDVFDFSAGERRTETIQGHAITYRVPSGPAVTGLHMKAANPQNSAEDGPRIWAEFVADHLVEWPWAEVEINAASLCAMMKKSENLFFEIANTIEEAGQESKNS